MSQQCETKWKRKNNNGNNKVSNLNKHKSPYGEILFTPLKNNSIRIADDSSTKLPLWDADNMNYIEFDENYDDEPITEGFKEGADFEMFPDSSAYFKNCKSILKTNFPIRAIFTGVIDTVMCPFYNVDKSIENLLLNLFNNDISYNSNNNNSNSTNDNSTFLNWKNGWTSYEPPQFDSFVEGITTTPSTTTPSSITEETTSPVTTIPVTTSPYMYNSIDNFLNVYGESVYSIASNHSWIQQNNLFNNFAQYYCQQINEFINSYETYQDSDILNFNNQIDSDLNDRNSYIEILQNVEFTCFPNPNPSTTTTPPIDSSFFSNKISIIQKKASITDPNILKDVKVIKNFIYQVLLLPIYFYISYNFYFLMFFRKEHTFDEDGNLSKLGCIPTEFPDWDSIFDNKFTGLFTEFIFKPAKIITIFLNGLKHDEFVYCLNKVVPYLSFILLFGLLMLILNSALPQIFTDLQGFYNFKVDSGLYIYCSVIIWISFVVSMFKSFGDLFIDKAINMAQMKGPPPTFWGMVGQVLLNIIYWIIKGAITSMIIPISAFIFVMYFLYLMFFGIGEIKNIEYINQYIYSKLFETENINSNIFADEDKGNKYQFWITYANKIIDILRTLSNYVFTYLFEFILLVLFFTYIGKSSAIINSDKMPSIWIAFLIISILFIVIMGIWVFNFKIPNLYTEDNKPVVGEPEPECEYEKNTQNIDNLFNSIKTEVMKTLKINEKIEEIQNSLMNSKMLMGEHANKFGNFMKDTGNGMSKGLGDFTQLSKEKLGNLMSGTSELTGNLKGNLKEGLKGLKQGFKDGLKDTFNQALPSLF